MKQLSIDSAPIVLSIHLKVRTRRFLLQTGERFEQNIVKLDTFVEYPEVLDISPFLSTNRG